MAIGPDQKAAFVAFNRFSFGARGGAYAGDLARAASDPRGFLKAELMQPAIAHLDTPGLPQTKTALATLFAFREQRRKERGLANTEPAPHLLGPVLRDALHRGTAEVFAVEQIQDAARRATVRVRLFQYRFEHRLELTGRGIDDLQYLGGRSLLLQ